ncbi:hypothetical protein E3P89_02507 [Wallemia ichthyophaga]|uniref:ATP-dependent DNA helicase II subunit 2 n=1 Tax=Wallemia ichthyophaga TaxID=245174 RepID=A0A4T0I2V1_WALIC|nr:hypothetical protein E3P90_02580 [Wallemia ichthyophaga]TIB11816.1 hypothetical protein E3P93_02477 [Wallemia ichthyophaga]TIB21654.1 hypothetical protein E3P89_02507 [Wallemia ichthyophaga]TIB23328.1 hypothetical protein E3P88_02599 [Wallemia ichthyophaga]
MSSVRSGYSINLYVIHLTHPSHELIRDVKDYINGVIINKIINNLKTDLIGLIVVDGGTNNTLHNESTNQFRHLNSIFNLQQSNKSLLSLVDSLDLSNPPIVDPIDSLIVAYNQIEIKYASKKSWSKSINYITDNQLATDGTDYITLLNSLNQLNITLNVINSENSTTNVFLTNLTSELYSSSTTTFQQAQQRLHKPISNASKSTQMYNNLSISDKYNFSVKYAKAVGKATKLPLKILEGVTQDKATSAPIHKLDDEEVEGERLIRAYNYGSNLVPAPSETEGGFVQFESPGGIHFLCAYPAHTLRRDWVVGEPAFICADMKDLPAQCALSSIIHALHRNNLIALVRYARKDGEKPYLGVCIPVVNKSDEYLQYLRIPFADQIRTYSFPSLEREGGEKRSGNGSGASRHLPTDEQCVAMDAFVDSMEVGGGYGASGSADEGEGGGDNDGNTNRKSDVGWFDIHESLSPATHRIYQAVVHSAARGRIDPESLPPPHPEVVKYLNPPAFTKKRAKGAIERCTSLFGLFEHTPQPKKTRYGRKGGNEDRQRPQEINIDELLGGGGSGVSNAHTNTNTTHNTLSNPVQTWNEMEEGDKEKAEEVHELMSTSIVTAASNSETYAAAVEGLEVLRGYATKHNVAEDYNELLGRLKEMEKFFTYLRNHDGEALSLITAGEDEQGVVETVMFARTFLRSTSRQATRAFSTARPASSLRNVAFGVSAAAALGATALATQPLHLDAPQQTIAGQEGTFSERSFVMIKPDGVSRQIVGKIISRFEERGYKLVAVKSVTPSKELAKEHYVDLAQRPFYPGLVDYITSGTPVVALVWEGKDVIRQGRRMVGATNPLQSDPGSIRGTYAVSVGRNIIHASDSFESATKEIGLWFNDKEMSSYQPTAWPWIFSDN